MFTLWVCDPSINLLNALSFFFKHPLVCDASEPLRAGEDWKKVLGVTVALRQNLVTPGRGGHKLQRGKAHSLGGGGVPKAC